VPAHDDLHRARCQSCWSFLYSCQCGSCMNRASSRPPLPSWSGDWWLSWRSRSLHGVGRMRPRTRGTLGTGVKSSLLRTGSPKIRTRIGRLGERSAIGWVAAEAVSRCQSKVVTRNTRSSLPLEGLRRLCHRCRYRRIDGLNRCVFWGRERGDGRFWKRATSWGSGCLGGTLIDGFERTSFLGMNVKERKMS
jgi:hypothetical protein